MVNPQSISASLSTHSYMSLSSEQRLKLAFRSLIEAADAVEDYDTPLAELILSVSDLLDGFLRQQRDVQLTDDGWTQINVRSQTTLRVIARIISQHQPRDPATHKTPVGHPKTLRAHSEPSRSTLRSSSARRPA